MQKLVHTYYLMGIDYIISHVGDLIKGSSDLCTLVIIIHQSLGFVCMSAYYDLERTR